MNATTRETLEAIRDIRDAMNKIVQLSIDSDAVNDAIVSGYPFDESLDDIALQVGQWAVSVSEVLFHFESQDLDY